MLIGSFRFGCGLERPLFYKNRQIEKYPRGDPWEKIFKKLIEIMRMNLGRFLFRIAASCRSEPPGLSQNNVKADLVNPVNSFPFPKLNHSEESMGNLSRSKTFSKICKFWSIVIILVEYTVGFIR